MSVWPGDEMSAGGPGGTARPSLSADDAMSWRPPWTTTSSPADLIADLRRSRVGRTIRGSGSAPVGRPRAAGYATTDHADEYGEPGIAALSPADSATPAIDVDALVRDQVMAALVERGVVPRGTGVGARRARAALTSSGASVRQEPGSREVHVHIDRVEVRPPAAPPPAAPARSSLPPVDHAAYLARRRGGDR